MKNFLTEDKLQKLPTKRLISLLNMARAKESSIKHYSGPRCCEVCHDFVGSEEEWQEVLNESRPFSDYIKKIKNILKTRPHVERKIIRSKG